MFVEVIAMVTNPALNCSQSTFTPCYCCVRLVTWLQEIDTISRVNLIREVVVVAFPIWVLVFPIADQKVVLRVEVGYVWSISVRLLIRVECWECIICHNKTIFFHNVHLIYLPRWHHHSQKSDHACAFTSSAINKPYELFCTWSSYAGMNICSTEVLLSVIVIIFINGMQMLSTSIYIVLPLFLRDRWIGRVSVVLSVGVGIIGDNSSNDRFSYAVLTRITNPPPRNRMWLLYPLNFSTLKWKICFLNQDNCCCTNLDIMVLAEKEPQLNWITPLFPADVVLYGLSSEGTSSCYRLWRTNMPV